jgi:hypothetical protein
MTKEQKISAYNRLNGAMAVVDEMVKLYSPEPEVLSELMVAYTGLKMAQDNLGWDPGGKVTEPHAK